MDFHKKQGHFIQQTVLLGVYDHGGTNQLIRKVVVRYFLKRNSNKSLKHSKHFHEKNGAIL